MVTRKVDEIDKVSMDFVAWIAECRGQGIDWLDDDDRAGIAATLDSDEPGVVRLNRLLDIIENRVDEKAVAQWLRDREDVTPSR